MAVRFRCPRRDCRSDRCPAKRIFSCLTTQQDQLLGQERLARRYETGQVVIHYDTPALAVLSIHSGVVKLTRSCSNGPDRVRVYCLDHAMGAYYQTITEEQAALIRAARLFFVASADPDLAKGPHGIGPVNVSPRGGVTLHILSPTRVAFLDFPGSGNETTRHSTSGGPVTVMVCSFEAENAAIVRLYGHAKATPIAESSLAPTLLRDAPPDARPRQVIEVAIESTMTSCGYGVPVMEFVQDRGPEGRGRRYKAKS